MHIHFPTFQKSFGWGSETFKMFKWFKWSLTWPWKRLMTFAEIYKQSIHSPRTNMEPKKHATWQTILSPFGGNFVLFSGAKFWLFVLGRGFLDGDISSLRIGGEWHSRIPVGTCKKSFWVLSLQKVVSHAQEKNQISFHPLGICERHNTSLQFLVIRFIAFDYIIFAYSIQSPVMLLIFIILTIFDYPMSSGWTTPCTCTVSYVLHQFFLVQCFSDIIYTKKNLKINLEHNSLEVWFRSFSFSFHGWLLCRFQALIFLGWNTKGQRAHMTPESPLKMMSPGTGGPRPGPRLGPHFSRWTFLRIARLQRLRILWRESCTCHLIPSSCCWDWKKLRFGLGGFTVLPNISGTYIGGTERTLKPAILGVGFCVLHRYMNCLAIVLEGWEWTKEVKLSTLAWWNWREQWTIWVPGGCLGDVSGMKKLSPSCVGIVSWTMTSIPIKQPV